MELQIIGRSDQLDLPDFGLYDVPAKIDTGAYGNAIHASSIRVVEKEGTQQLEFKLLDRRYPQFIDVYHYTTDFTQKKVKSSSGHLEQRFAIKTTLVVFGKRYRVLFSLTNRKKMRFSMLIGRKFLKSRFLVDVNAKNQSFEAKLNK